jgi:hypothetical protein
MSTSTGQVLPRAANDPIDLGLQQGRLRIGATVADNVTVALLVRMLPRPRVLIEGSVDSPSFSIARDLSDLSNADFTFHGSKTRTPIVIAHASEGDSFAFSAWPHKEVIDYKPRQPVASIHGVILNFYASYEAIGTGAARKIPPLGDETWAITLKAQPNLAPVVDQLDREGGYGVTHLFDVTRTNGETISPQSTVEILDALKTFFSFARGAHCGLGLLKGIGVSGTVLWQQWGFSGTSRWSTTANWFSSPQGQFLRGVFPGFMREWNTDSREHVRSAVEMYAEANRDEPDVKPSLMLAQSALELLSWLSMVRGLCLSPDGFRGLSAADHIRLLLHECRIPPTVPSTLAGLVKAAKAQKLDGPSVLTEVRNTLVHPGKSNKKMTVAVFGDAWTLSMWYLELALLRRFGYNGPYLNRVLSPPALEPVPWLE